MVAPRHTSPYGGVDRGAAGRILVEIRSGNEMDCQLVWRSGFRTASAGVRGFGHHHVPTSLHVTDRIGMGRPGGGLLTGGRLTNARIAQVAGRIDELLGMPVAHLVEVGKTLVVVV
jgi:hypothetical protein